MEIGETIGKKSKNAREKRASKKKKEEEEKERKRNGRGGGERRGGKTEAHFSMHGCNLNAVRTRM